MKKVFKYILAFLHIKYVCEMSKGIRDFHDYPDSIEGKPFHMIELTCKYCGKKFRI